MKDVALIVIDVQNDFVEEGALIEVESIRQGLQHLREFISFCRDKGATIIFTKHLFDPKLNPVEAKLFPSLHKSGLREGSKGAEIHSEVFPEESDLVITKRRYDAFFGTELEQILREKGIEKVIITGTMTEVCCESTARSAMYRDFEVLFVSDLTFTSDSEVHKNTLKTIKSHFGEVMDSKEIIDLL